MPGNSQIGEITLAAAIRRYFDVGLYLLIFTGFATLASTGRLDIPTVLLVSLALLFRGYFLARRWHVLLSERWTNILTIACVGFFIADEFLISRTFLSASVHLVLFVMLVRLFSAQRDRDHYLLAVLAFLMVLSAAVLTVDSTFLIALAGFVLVAVATFILMEMMHSSQRAPVQARDPQVPQVHRKLSFTIAGIAPLLLLLIFLGGAFIFFLLPRVSAGYLSAYTGSNDLSTGFSDRVELGRIGEIQRSKAVAMHVQVDGDTVGIMSLKMRGIALNYFDGKSWTNTRQRFVLRRGSDARFNLLSRDGQVLKGRTVHYRVTMEPFLNEVFFLLATPESLEGNYRVVSVDSAGDVYDIDNEHPVSRYEADSILRGPASARHANSPLVDQSETQRMYLQLPVLDSRIPGLARQITEKSSGPLDQASAIESYLRMKYGYTLELPSPLPSDPIANFLFVRKQGHCEYFASSMAVMLRSLGIPSRVVNGFSGGEFNDLTSQYVIRASDAHSWVEAYIPGEGWLQFDPTPPGGEQVHTQWDRFLLYVDAMASFWREWVINYDLGHQLRLTQDASRGSRELVGHAQSWGRRKYEAIVAWASKTLDQIGDSTVKWGLRVLAVILIGLTIAVLPRAIALLRRMRLARRPQAAPQVAATIWYERMLRQAARHGWQKSPAQTPEEFAAAIADEQLKIRVSNFTVHYEGARFGKSAEEASLLPGLYEEVKAGASGAGQKNRYTTPPPR